jgi:hypothetical protein
MKRILTAVCTLLLISSQSMATDVTWVDKTTGGSFTHEDANEVKSAVNSKADIDGPVFTNSPTAPGYLSNVADGGRMVNIHNSVGFSGTAEIGMCEYSTYRTPAGLYCYTGTTYGWVLQNGSTSGTTFTKQATTPTATSAAGLYGNTTTGIAYYSDSVGLWNLAAGTYTPWPTPMVAPTAYVISGSGPQVLTITHAEGATAGSTADLCNDFGITMGVAGSLTLGYVSGDTTSSVVCSIAQDVFSTDTVVAPATYTPGTIAATDDGGALAAISDFSSLVTNSSSEVYTPPGGCGTSTIDVTDAFSGDLTGFTQDSGTWVIAGGYVVSGSSGTVRYLRSNTDLTTAACQWAEMGGFGDFTSGSLGVFSRATGATGYRYGIRITYVSDEASQLQWNVYNGTALVQNVQLVDIPFFATTSRLMAQVVGTGNDTVVNVWVNASGTKPSDSSAPDYVLTNNPTTAVDTGTMGGLLWHDWVSPLSRITSFKAGH